MLADDSGPDGVLLQPGRWGSGRLKTRRCAGDAEVVENTLDRLVFLNHGDDLAPAAALAACQDVNGEGSLQHLGPCSSPALGLASMDCPGMG